MLIIPLKAMTRFDMMVALAEWLDGDQQVGFNQQTFSPANPLQFIVPKPDFKSTDCRKDLLRLASVRNCLADAMPRSDSHKNALVEENALSDCHEYHAILLEFEKQGFPTIDDSSNGLHLTYKAAFAPLQSETHSTLVWDRACTLWNLAALESCLAADYDFTTKDGCKAIIQHCQNAASTLAIVKELVSSQDFVTVDLSPPMLQFWERFLVAQAQYAVYKMATMADAPNHSILSYLSQGVVSIFNEALTNAQDHRLQSEVPKEAEEWGSYCKAQSMLASAKAEFHQAVQHRLKTQWGLEIARLTKCMTYLEACQQFLKALLKKTSSSSSSTTKSTDHKHNKAAAAAAAAAATATPATSPLPEVERQVEALVRLVGDRNRQAQKDNTSVYQDRVPTELDDIPTQILAKANLPMPTTMLVPKVPLFVNVRRHA